MKIILLTILITLTFSNVHNAHAKYTKRKFTRLEAQLIEQRRYLEKKLNKKKELKGIGFVFQSDLVIKEKDNKKYYQAFVRGCGFVSLPIDKKNEELMKKIKEHKNGDNIHLRLKEYDSCEVGDWDFN